MSYRFGRRKRARLRTYRDHRQWARAFWTRGEAAYFGTALYTLPKGVGDGTGMGLDTVSIELFARITDI